MCTHPDDYLLLVGQLLHRRLGPPQHVRLHGGTQVIHSGGVAPIAKAVGKRFFIWKRAWIEEVEEGEKLLDVVLHGCAGHKQQPVDVQGGNGFTDLCSGALETMCFIHHHRLPLKALLWWCDRGDATTPYHPRQ